MPKRGAKRNPRMRVLKLSPKQLAAKLVKQKEQRKHARQQQQAEKAARAFRPRKTDKGKIVFIGRDGNREASLKGRKGYTVFVDKHGKKSIIQNKKTGFKSSTISDIELPVTKKTRKAAKEFLTSRRKLMESGRSVIKESGTVKPKGPYDFSDKVAGKIAKGLSKTFKGQLSQRRFLVSANILIRREDGSHKVYTVQVPIAKPDHLAIREAGIMNFVKRKFYAHLARELAFDGYVTSGSANHVRRLAENEGKDRDEWTQDGDLWQGHDYETVKIEQIEWKIEQMR